MLDLGSRPSSDVAQQTCSQLRPRSSRRSTSCGFSLSPASTAVQSKALTRGSIEVLDTIFVGLYRRLRQVPLQGSRRRGVQRRTASLSAEQATPFPRARRELQGSWFV